jgi:hypothetical protein
MAGTIIADKIQTENSFLTLNVGQTLVATINSSGILNSSGGTMISANGAVSNTAITGLITAAQIATVANTQITGDPLFSAGSNTAPSITTSGDTDTGIYFPSANTIAFTRGGIEVGRFDSTANANFQFNSGYGSAATAYGCRAWVNFNGTGTVAIRASGNVSSITDNGTGDYTVNFTTAMPDANYSVTLATTGANATTNQLRIMQILGADATGASTKTVSALRIIRGQTDVAGGFVDSAEVNVAIFR